MEIGFGGVFFGLYRSSSLFFKIVKCGNLQCPLNLNVDLNAGKVNLGKKKMLYSFYGFSEFLIFKICKISKLVSK